jgi:hypothetical protein
MECLPPFAGASLLLLVASGGAAQSAADTMPARVVERMLEAFDRGDQTARSALYDSVFYFQDLMVPRPGDPRRPRAISAEERAREWRAVADRMRADTLPRRAHRRLERLVAGRFVVYRVAVRFEPPHQDQSFEKLEVYEVRQGKIVAEYDGQYTASGP